ncbi:phosphoglycerate mutase [Ferrithrix thermotolerans DSM 19514]|uniref:2,3-bisphosphoglycerate-dependent phosphoglycerate mutase n=1 Tax=Ferrithrix thermotolerans DSM 19514 TaxID=1121881 RepID=A0A1M4TWM8_9ACTN|nr:2,3-diphosphoglycerate-dependent phosphoglycerate mutase [Ferrithrix thermotolerans]SHE48850.1 phosphoglycerate mutase [Ferrithrix thermotolerans DSM 19514]
MSTLILLRHGQSTWNLENRFTGWVDVDLTEQGIKEAIRAGQALLGAEILPSVAYTSVLRRAVKTLDLALYEMGLSWIPVKKSWRLNERHYGALQGLNKAETAKKYGDAQVKLWRRSYDVPPPALKDREIEALRKDPRYRYVPKELLPKTECLKDVMTRMMPLWYDDLAPQLLGSETVLVSAHGNSIRALIKHLENISDQDIVEYEVPNGEPIVYELDDGLNVTSKATL